MALLSLLTVLFTSFANANDNAAKPPNIVFMLTDDLGWNSMYHNSEDKTPTLDGMVKTSLILKSFYVYKYCAPTRASFLTGRLPYKLSATRDNFLPPSRPEGTNLAYTMIAAKLKQAVTPYKTYHIGKWHQGLFAPEYMPINRGFDKSYGFLSGGEDHFTQHIESCSNFSSLKHGVVDLTDSGSPAYGKNGTYNGYAFTDMAIKYISDHVKNTPNNPFFLYYALHNVHGPIEAPADIINMYHFNQTLRNTFDAMTTIVDQSVKNVTDALKSLNVWDNTLFIWTSDNGAPVQVSGSNAPFRGSKASNWEGGVHVPLLISGGILPTQMQGQSLDGLIHIVDWYATFCYLAGGINPNDTNKGVPSPIDSINMWPYISGKVKESPRNIIVHDHLMYTGTTQGAIRNGSYKLIKMNLSYSSWYGQFSPNESWNTNMEHIYACSVKTPCLFDITNDVTEHKDLSKQLPDVVEELTQLFYSYDNEYHPPKNSPADEKEEYCEAALAAQGFCVPWHKNQTPKQ